MTMNKDSKAYTRPYESLLHQTQPKTDYGGYTIKLDDDKLKELFYKPEEGQVPLVRRAKREVVVLR